MAKEPKYPVQTVIKAIEIINYLAKDTGNRGIGISEFSQVLGMGKSTIHRLLDTLQFYGYIEKNPETNRYRLGWELYKIGQVIPQQNQLFNIDKSSLIELSNRTQELVNLGVLKNRETVIISKIEGAREGLRVSMNPGEYESIYATALGKMMISELGEEKIRTLLEDADHFPTFTPNTISNVTELLKDIEQIQQRGYAIDAEEFCIGLYCIAMPLRNYTGKIIGAVSVSTPTVRMNEEKKALIIDALGATTRNISESLGYRV